MAESDVKAPSQLKFYCHQCKERLPTVPPNLTCPRCSLGFIEEVEIKPEPKQDAPVPEDDNNILRYGDFHDHSLQHDAFERRGGNDRNELSDPESNRRITRVAEAPSENLLEEIVFDHASAFDFFYRTVNLEVFSRDFDASITRIENLMFNTRTPPVSKEVSDTLGIVEVTPEHVSTQLNCSICWEIYVLGEKVRQLPCGHNYHDTCIRCWFLIQQTCPMCRKHIIENETTTDGLSTSNASSAIEALDSIAYEENGPDSPSSSTASRGLDSSTSSHASSSNSDPRI